MVGSREAISASLPSLQGRERIAFIDQVLDGSLPTFPNVPRANFSGELFRYQGRRYSVRQEQMVHGIMITGESYSPVDRVGEVVRVVRGTFTFLLQNKKRTYYRGAY